MGTAGLDAAHLRAEPTAPRRVPEYRTPPLAAPRIVAPAADAVSWLEPLNGIFDERYAVYWKVATGAAQAGAG